MSYIGGIACSPSMILVAVSNGSASGSVSTLERDEGPVSPAETATEAELLYHVSVRSEGR